MFFTRCLYIAFFLCLYLSLQNATFIAQNVNDYEQTDFSTKSNENEPIANHSRVILQNGKFRVIFFSPILIQNFGRSYPDRRSFSISRVVLEGNVQQGTLQSQFTVSI